MQQSRNFDLSRIVKFCISALALVGLSFSRVIARLFGTRRRPRCVVLYYHSVPAAFRDRFGKQLDAILQHSEPIHPTHMDSLRIGSQYCLVTFDDGFSNFIEIALPELAARKIPSLMFIITEALGKSFGPSEAPETVMTLEQLGNLPEALVMIGSHTLTHPYLPDIPEQDAREEIMQSRLRLERLINKPVLFFSFPFGGMNSRLVSLCRQAGYSRVFSTVPQSTSFGDADYCVGRVRVDPWDWPAEFRLKVAGAYCWLPAAISLKRLLRNSLVAVLNRPAKRNSDVRTRQSFIHR
jgi:peptidoglycan/xylan/chitin deacetylase (PgdA/CDA1 family)